MPSVTFDLETITPLFLGGADQTIAELRPPAFRGALRYWFRAIAASITSFDEVKKWENKVFGSTDAGGAIIIRIHSPKTVSSYTLKRNNDFLGLAYLFFSTYETRGEARGCFTPGSEFKLTLQTRLSRSEDLQYLHLAIGAMWMLVKLGGLGSRSNRGGGSLGIKKEPETIGNFKIDKIKFLSHSVNVDQLASAIKDGISIIKQLYTEVLNGNKVTLTVPTSFDIINPQTAMVYLWQSQNAEENYYWDFILNSFGREYKGFRIRYKNATYDDYKEVKYWLKSGGKTTVTTIKRAAFGLPIQFYFKSLPGKKASLEATGNIKRSSSPLHIRVVRLAQGGLAVLIIHFKTQLLPNGRKLLLQSKSINKRLECSVPNQDIIDQEFIPSLSNITPVIIP